MADAPRLHPRTIPSGDRRLFVLDVLPASTDPHAWLIHLPPLGEEMIRARRPVSLIARRFAASGIGVRLLDPTGTGDSGGDGRDVTLRIWTDDLHAAYDDATRRIDVPVAIWGTRAGALIAAQVAWAHAYVFLAPVRDGRAYVRQTRRVAQNESGAAAGSADQRPDSGLVWLWGHPIPRAFLDELAGLALAPASPTESGGCLLTVRDWTHREQDAPAHDWSQVMPAPRFWAVEGAELPDAALTVVDAAAVRLRELLAAPAATNRIEAAHAPRR